MESDTKSWLHGAADRSLKAVLMTADKLTKKQEPLDSDEMEELRLCWENVKCIVAAKQACAQLEAHEAANAPASLDDLMRMMRRMQAKLGILEPNGNGVVKPAA